MAKKDKPRGEGPALTPALLKKTVEAAVETAFEKYLREKKQSEEESRDKRLHNTELLLKKYRGLKEYSDDAVFDATQVKGDQHLQEILDLMSHGESSHSISVRSMRERVAQVRIILHHVDKMLNFYEFQCKKGSKDEEHKWETVYLLYLSDEEKTIQEIAEVFEVDMSTAYRYRRTAINDLSTLFFGVIE